MKKYATIYLSKKNYPSTEVTKWLKIRSSPTKNSRKRRKELRSGTRSRLAFSSSLWLRPFLFSDTYSTGS